MQNVISVGDEDASATRLTPDVLITCAGRTVVVIAGEELAFVDPQLTVEEMQFFYARVRMRRVTRSGRKAYQHADAVPFGVGREQLAFDPRRDLFPFRLGPLLFRRQHWFRPTLIG